MASHEYDRRTIGGRRYSNTSSRHAQRRTTIWRIREVGLRDGLQILARAMPTDRKLEWRGSYDAGCAK
jgi:hypothetical protein